MPEYHSFWLENSEPSHAAELPERCASPGLLCTIAGEPHESIYRSPDLAFSRVVDHVPLTGQEGQRALGYLLVQATGVIAGIYDGVHVARDDRKRHPQPRVDAMGAARGLAQSSLDRTDGVPHAKAERLEPIPHCL